MKFWDYVRRIVYAIAWFLSALWALYISSACVPAKKVAVAPVIQPAPVVVFADTVPSIVELQLDSTLAAMLQGYRDILQVETVLCLFGLVRADTATVVLVRPTPTANATATGVAYADCTEAPHAYFGPLTFLGMWHNHSEAAGVGAACYFSTIDLRSFYESKRALVDVVSCRGDMIWRARGTPLVRMRR